MRKRHIAVGFSIIIVGLILFITPVSLPHKEGEPITVDMTPIYKGLVGIPLILVGITIATAGFVKRIRKNDTSTYSRFVGFGMDSIYCNKRFVNLDC